jgi:hypothetical protein
MWDPSTPNDGGPGLRPGEVDHHNRRRWATWAGFGALFTVVVVGASYEGPRLWNYLPQWRDEPFAGFDLHLQRAIAEWQSGGTAANAAATVAAPQPPGSLTVASLNAALPQYQWVDGATNVPYSAKRPIVSMTASGTHIETAVEDGTGSCSFGLTITSDTDPLTTEDHVAGIGRYYHLVGPGAYWQSVYQPRQCAADQAPASGWTPWPQSLASFESG